MTRVDLPITQIVDRLEQKLEELVFEFWPAAERHGGVIYCNPGKDDLGSFQVFLVTRGKQIAGHWARYSQGRGGNVLNLIAYGLSGETEHKPVSYGPAILWAKQWLGLARPETEAERRRREARQERGRRERAEKAAAAAARTVEHVAEIRAGSRRVDFADATNPVVRYLSEFRGFDLAAIKHFCAPLRFHPDLWHWKAHQSHPAMVADVVASGHAVAVHCTYLAPGGAGKARLPKGRSAKLMRGEVGGGLVPITLGPTGLSLGAAEAAGVSSPLVVCEGIETGVALACGLDEARIWAALSIGNIGALAPLIAGSRAISAVILAKENDVKPQAIKDREHVLALLEETGRPVYTMRSHVGSDFADLYKEED